MRCPDCSSQQLVISVHYAYCRECGREYDNGLRQIEALLGFEPIRQEPDIPQREQFSSDELTHSDELWEKVKVFMLEVVRGE